MTINEKVSKLDKIGKEFTDTLKELGLCYHLSIVGRNDAFAIESSTLTNIEKMAAVVCDLHKILEQSGITRKFLFEHINRVFDKIEESKGERNEQTDSDFRAERRG